MFLKSPILMKNRTWNQIWKEKIFRKVWGLECEAQTSVWIGWSYDHNCALTTLKWCYSSSQELLCVVELVHEFGSKSHIQRFIANYQCQVINTINVCLHCCSFKIMCKNCLYNTMKELFFSFPTTVSFSSRLKELAVMFSLGFESPLFSVMMHWW